jgi:cobalt-zinc-cadmium resistance protein CzcA
VQRPLAAVVVGGMFIGPIILLVVVPALQTLLVGEEDASPPTPGREGPDTTAART